MTDNLQTLQPQLNQQQIQQDTQTMMQQPEIPQLQEGEQVASLGAWAARNILKVAKPNPLEKREIIKVVTPKVKSTKTIDRTPDAIEVKYEDGVVERLKNQTGVDVNTLDIDTQQSIARATDLSNAELKDFDTTDSFQINFDLIESGEDVTTTIAQMAEANKTQIDEVRRGVVTDEQLTGLANDLGQDPNFIKNFLAREQGTAINAETVLATRQMLELSAKKLKSLSDKLVSGGLEATEQDKINFSKQWEFHRQFQQQFMGMRAEFGRGLRAFGVSMGDMEQNKIKEVISMMANNYDVMHLANQISVADSTRAINGVVQAQQDGIFMKGTKVFTENFIASILSGVKTQIVNTTGSALRLGMDTADTLTASLLGSKVPSSQEKIVADEATAKLFGMVNGFRDALSMAAKTAKTTEPYGGIDKLDTLQQKAITSEYLGLKKDSVAGKVVDTYGNVVRIPLERVMGATDSFFKVLAERMQLAGLAYRKTAHSQLQGQEALDYLDNLMKNPTAEMVQEIENFGLDITFQKPLGETGRGLQRIVNQVPILKMVMPFIKTPTNILKQAYLERTPLGMFSQEYKDAVAKGGASAQMAQAKMVNGTLMALTAFTFASNGTLTGSDPKDPKVRTLRHEAGWRPRSIVFDNEDGTKDYVSYDRLEPFSLVFGIVSDLVDFQSQIMYDDVDEDVDKQVQDAATNLIAAFSMNSLDKSFMTGLSSMMEVLSDPKRYGKTYVQNMVNAIVPLSGARRDAAKVQDDLYKSAFTITERLQASTPYFNKNIPNKLNNFGETVKYDTIFSPWATATSTKDSVKLEVLRLAESTKSVPFSLPQKRINGIDLNAQQYHDLVLYARKELRVKGKNFHDVLKETMSSNLYKAAPSDDARVMMIRAIKDNFDNAAKLHFFNIDESIKNKYIDKKKRETNKLLGVNYGIQ